MFRNLESTTGQYHVFCVLLYVVQVTCNYNASYHILQTIIIGNMEGNLCFWLMIYLNAILYLFNIFVLNCIYSNVKVVMKFGPTKKLRSGWSNIFFQCLDMGQVIKLLGSTIRKKLPIPSKMIKTTFVSLDKRLKMENLMEQYLKKAYPIKDFYDCTVDCTKNVIDFLLRDQTINVIAYNSQSSIQR